MSNTLCDCSVEKTAAGYLVVDSFLIIVAFFTVISNWAFMLTIALNPKLRETSTNKFLFSNAAVGK